MFSEIAIPTQVEEYEFVRHHTQKESDNPFLFPKYVRISGFKYELMTHFPGTQEVCLSAADLPALLPTEFWIRRTL